MHLATDFNNQHAGSIRENENESYTSGSINTCVSMTITNNHSLVTLTGRHQYTHDGVIEVEPADLIDHGKTQEYRATNRGKKDTAAVVVYEVKSKQHLNSTPAYPYHRVFLAVACRNKIEKKESASTKYIDEDIAEQLDKVNVQETCVFLFRSDSPNFPEYNLLLRRFYEHYAVHLLSTISADDVTSWVYLIDNEISFIVKFNQVQNGDGAIVKISIEETPKGYMNSNNVFPFSNQTLVPGPVLDVPLNGFRYDNKYNINCDTNIAIAGIVLVRLLKLLKKSNRICRGNQINLFSWSRMLLNSQD
jgi:hypothetical protein